MFLDNQSGKGRKLQASIGPLSCRDSGRLPPFRVAALLRREFSRKTCSWQVGFHRRARRTRSVESLRRERGARALPATWGTIAHTLLPPGGLVRAIQFSIPASVATAFKILSIFLSFSRIPFHFGQPAVLRQMAVAQIRVPRISLMPRVDMRHGTWQDVNVAGPS